MGDGDKDSESLQGPAIPPGSGTEVPKEPLTLLMPRELQPPLAPPLTPEVTESLTRRPFPGNVPRLLACEVRHDSRGAPERVCVLTAERAAVAAA